MAGYIYSKIEKFDDINDRRNRMAKGNYPVSMTNCEVVGINGDCGYDCPVWRGKSTRTSPRLQQAIRCYLVMP